MDPIGPLSVHSRRLLSVPLSLSNLAEDSFWSSSLFYLILARPTGAPHLVQCSMEVCQRWLPAFVPISNKNCISELDCFHLLLRLQNALNGGLQWYFSVSFSLLIVCWRG